MYFVACMAIATCSPHPISPFTWRGPFSLSRVSATFDVEEGRSDAIQGPLAPARPTLFAFSTTVQFSASAITTHTTPTLPPLHHTKISVTDTHPPRLHIAPTSLAIISTRHAARRASPRRIICVSSSQGRKCFDPDCAAHNFTVASPHHTKFCTSEFHLWHHLLPRPRTSREIF
jgi:hypothetical protein